MTTVQPDTPVPAIQPLPFDCDAWRTEDAKRRAAAALEPVVEQHARDLAALARAGAIAA